MVYLSIDSHLTRSRTYDLTIVSPTPFRHTNTPTGRITGLARLFVRPSVPYGFLTQKRKDVKKTKIGVNVP